MLVRVFFKSDGEISVLHPAPKARLEGEDDITFLERVSRKAVVGTPLEGVRHEDMDDTLLPDRKDRHKWRAKPGGGIEVDMTVPDPIRKPTEIELLQKRVAVLEKRP